MADRNQRPLAIRGWKLAGLGALVLLGVGPCVLQGLLAWNLIARPVLAAAGRSVGDGVVQKIHEAERARAEADIACLANASLEFAATHAGRFPGSLRELFDAEPRVIDGPLDPWGHAYRYVPPTSDGTRALILSLGRDGMPGGIGSAADIEWRIGEDDHVGDNSGKRQR